MKRLVCRLTLAALVLSGMFISSDAWAQGRGDRGHAREGRGQYERSEDSSRDRDGMGGPGERRGSSERGSRDRDSGLEKDGSRHSDYIHSLPKARRR